MATDLDQVKRLISLNGTDPGFFILALYSFIEYYCKEELGENNWTREDYFDSIIENFINLPQHSVEYKKKEKLRKEISRGHRLTNGVRHKFETRSREEVIANIHRFLDFAQSFNLPYCNLLQTLRNTALWDNRQSPGETAKELQELNKQIAELKKNIENKIDIAKYNDLSREKTKLEAELEESKSSNSKKEKKNDNLRRDIFEMEGIIRQLKKRLAEEKATQEYINKTLRLTNYTRTRSEYEKELLRLTPEQAQIVNTVDFGRDYLIKGAAGTGKSVVIMKLLEKLKETKDGNHSNIRLITYTRNLVKYNKYMTKLFNISADQEMVVTSDSFLWRLFNTYNQQPGVENQDDIENAIKSMDFTDCPLPQQAFKSELIRFILPNAITKKEYCDDVIERRGMGSPLQRPDRKKVWEYLERCFELLEREKSINADYCFYKYAVAIKESRFKFKDELLLDYLIIDEVQDLNVAKLILCKSLVKKSLIMAGDNDQSIFGIGFSWKSAGIDIVGKTKTLHTNFRNTNEINEIAEKYRATIPNHDEEYSPTTYRVGPKPEIHFVESSADIEDVVYNYAELCIKQLDYAPENICIIVNEPNTLNRTFSNLNERFHKNLNIEIKSIDDEDFTFEEENVVKYTNTRKSKGLDFPVVLYILNKTLFGLEGWDQDSISKCNRNSIYTALSRSMDLLHVFVKKNPEEPDIQDLIKIMQE